jgi:hypothetical protein
MNENNYTELELMCTKAIEQMELIRDKCRKAQKGEANPSPLKKGLTHKQREQLHQQRNKRILNVK